MLRIRMTGNGESRGQPANPGLLGKSAVKMQRHNFKFQAPCKKIIWAPSSLTT